MSGVYIKGMEMPEDRPQLLWVYPNGKALTVQSDVDPWKDLQAIPVPPHGRLGDLDKLENGLRHMAKYQFGERQQGILGCCETIRLAPTIIPAESVENK